MSDFEDECNLFRPESVSF